jgi:hypothetical protein
MKMNVSFARPLYVLATVLSLGIPAASTYAQIYTEDFSDYAASDWSNGYCEVKWCPTPEVVGNVSCGNANAMRELGSTDDDIIWVHFGNRGCTSVTISFSYGQWQNSPPVPDGSDTKLMFKTSTSDTFSCSTGGFTQGLALNRTYPSTPQCFPATHTVNVSASDRSVYWMFNKGTFNTFFFADNVQITLGGCICGPGACITTLNQNFGTTFISGTVCSIFPGTFESCAGAGPYLSSGSACGNAADQVMTFGTGYPYSEATLRCLNLTGLTQASLQFNYSKTDSTLGPYLYASLNQTSWTTIWSAPFTFAGGCVPVCVDLGAYAGQAQVWLKFSSGYSSTQAHAIDDLLLVRGAACPPPTGSCCQPNGTCTVTAQAACTGTWTVDGTCTPNNCPQPTGSCCQQNGTCTVTTQAACTGTWTQGGTCTPNNCPQPTGSCCQADGSCTVTTEAACTGTWTLNGSCTPNDCPQPTGSCCQADGTCAVTPQAECTGTWTPSGTCDPNPCACPLMGDINSDGVIDGLDIGGFVDCILNAVGASNCRCGDFQHNGAVDMNDVGGFVAAMLP